jgi:hypothetical protein
MAPRNDKRAEGMMSHEAKAVALNVPETTHARLRPEKKNRMACTRPSSFHLQCNVDSDPLNEQLGAGDTPANDASPH